MYSEVSEKNPKNIVLATMEVQIKSARISTSAMATIEFAGLIQAALLVANDGQGVHVRDLYVYSEGRGTKNALDVLQYYILISYHSQNT